MCARFDWYQATVQTDLATLKGALEGVCRGAARWEPMERAPHGYGQGDRLHDAEGQVCMVWWAGSHELPHAVASGETAHDVAEVLRGEFGAGRHRVTRADACIDYAEPGAYERLQGIALDVAKDKGIKVGTAGDHLLRHEGRTLYLGAPTSVTRLRLYDKADELRAKLRNDVRALEVPDELARLECQVRPQTPIAKVAASQLSPVELMGSSAWMRELMLRVAGLELAPWQAGRPWRRADDERAYAAMLAQYGGMLARRLGDHGSWDLVGRQIGDDLAVLARAKRRARCG